MMTLSEIRYNPATSAVLLVVGLALKSSHTQSLLTYSLINWEINKL
jgi:hypothetical protein